MAAGKKDPIAEDSVEGIQQTLGEGTLLAVDSVRAQRRDLMRYVCELELDTNTIHRNLKLSENHRKVTYVSEEQPYPDHPERFDFWPQLLCRDGLTGRCYWEVEREEEERDGGREDQTGRD
ncbi:neoverrucotoxin subunit alpha-like [Etheostoma cragini]|uniref:neoverrucotoxin subunit alpha-like n=1 Tax=Etheostoma cragini TaxID=417921 RepID=UPI00155DED26|nr:neoverrucotoxin subunit alpha-like [Etheostoma cragini]